MGHSSGFGSGSQAVMSAASSIAEMRATTSAQSTNLIGSWARSREIYPVRGRRRRRRSRLYVCEINELSVQNPARCVLEKLKLPPGR
eukprot:6804560-Heterocapsa_arctica.AAC.1